MSDGYTVQRPNRAWEPLSESLPEPQSRSTILSPADALERDEILRTRKFCVVGVVVALAGALSVPLLPGDPTASWLVLASVGISLIAIGFLYYRTHDLELFDRPSTSLGWFVPAACVTTGIPFFGAFSPVPLVLVLGIYFTGLGRSRRLSYAVYAVCAGMQLLVSILVIAGKRDTGVIHPTGLTGFEQVVIQILVQGVMAATLVTARISRATTLSSLHELERAVRLAAHREALLNEAREELERALRRQGRGRFSDQTIGPYKLGALIGRGAMGEVYDARNAAGDVFAVKLLSQASLNNPQHILRFLRELRTAAQLKSPHIVKMIDVGEHPVPFLVMERLEGVTLSEKLRQKSLAPKEIVELIRQVGAGITAAASAGIVHRDLKPQNVFDHHGTWKILDFGIARAIDAGDTLTAGHVVGTPSYMAPEQAAGHDVDHRADLYALAAIAYRAITGQPPYAAGEIAETIYKVVHTRPRRPSLLSDCGPAIDDVLAIGLAREADDRFQSATELAAALAAAFNGTLVSEIRTRARDDAWAPTPRASTAKLKLR
ncbi:MAG: serine/threonine-protein kinase [Kofleriaceae bacterium]